MTLDRPNIRTFSKGDTVVSEYSHNYQEWKNITIHQKKLFPKKTDRIK